ncbi:MAG: sensor histidine kinase, partial [Ignavibacteriales bacterium]
GDLTDTLSISDTGIGIPQEKINKLFQVGENTSTRGTAGEIGTGLGLILCKDLLEKNGHKIYVISESGKGSTFYFTIEKANAENREIL